MAGLIDQIVGHDNQKKTLFELLKSDQLPSAMIFQGPAGVGKKTLAHALLQVINCTKSEKACGECSNCQRIFEEKNELVYHVELEKKSMISVDQVREMQASFSLKSLHKGRFVIIDPADQMSPGASNALLKVLEEPPPNTYFILITDQLRRLLPTIRSRSHIFHFNKLSEEDLKSYDAFGKLPLLWSDGRLEMALDLREEDNVNHLNASLKFLYDLLYEQGGDWKKLAPWFFNDREKREFCLNIWKQALSKRLYKEPAQLDWMPEEPQAITFFYEELEKLKGEMEANVDKLLSIENFQYKLRRGLNERVVQ
jgi:DNA polymerase III delta' subunit